jgi:hypothetical protein
MSLCGTDWPETRANAINGTGLKIPRGKTRAGSIPASGTSVSSYRSDSEFPHPVPHGFPQRTQALPQYV